MGLSESSGVQISMTFQKPLCLWVYESLRCLETTDSHILTYFFYQKLKGSIINISFEYQKSMDTQGSYSNEVWLKLGRKDNYKTGCISLN